MTDGKQNPG